MTVINFPTKSTADDVLTAAKTMGLKNVIVLGQTEDGSDYLDAHITNIETSVYLLRRAEYTLMGALDEACLD